MILSGHGWPDADEYSTAESDVEICDQLEIVQNRNIEVDAVKEKTATVQDLLFAIKNADLADALPRAMNLIQLALVTPLTSVHCEGVFSRMKHLISTARSWMLQQRKEALVFLQAEHKLLRYLAEQPSFKENAIERFESHNHHLDDFQKNGYSI